MVLDGGASFSGKYPDGIIMLVREASDDFGSEKSGTWTCPILTLRLESLLLLLTPWVG